MCIVVEIWCSAVAPCAVLLLGISLDAHPLCVVRCAVLGACPLCDAAPIVPPYTVVCKMTSTSSPRSAGRRVSELLCLCIVASWPDDYFPSRCDDYAGDTLNESAVAAKTTQDRECVSVSVLVVLASDSVEVANIINGIDCGKTWDSRRVLQTCYQKKLIASRGISPCPASSP